MTTPRMYLAAAALSALALGVTVAAGWGQDFPDGESPGSGSGLPLADRAADRPPATTRVEANVQHADVILRPDADVIWN